MTKPKFYFSEEETKTISIDFDQVIHNDNLGWHDGTIYGEPIDGSLDAVRKLAEKYTLVLFTAKAKPDRPLVDGKQAQNSYGNGLKNITLKIVLKK